MVVRNEETLEEALQMIRASGPVRYSDRYVYIIVTHSETLEDLCRKALARDDIAIVVPHGREREMENYTQALTRVKRQRVAEEKRRIREWVKEHPEIAEAPAEEIPKVVRRMRKGELK